MHRFSYITNDHVLLMATFSVIEEQFMQVHSLFPHTLVLSDYLDILSNGYPIRSGRDQTQNRRLNLLSEAQY